MSLYSAFRSHATSSRRSVRPRLRAHGRQHEPLEARRLMSVTPSSAPCACPSCQPALADALAEVGGTSQVMTMTAPMAAMSQPVSPLVSPPTRLTSAHAAAEEVHRQAGIAATEGQSYGVGGAIVENKTGRIIHAYGNRVNGQLKGDWYFPSDPTNHGETQLVGWYYDNRALIRQQLGYLPAPRDLTVVTSLDPCAMCAGTLLTAGFNVAVIAPDDSGGGVNWAATGEFAHVPPKVQAALRTNFGYYKVTGVDLRANYTGGTGVIYHNEVISESIYDANFTVFEASLQNVGDVRANRQKSKNLLDITTLPAGDPLRTALESRWPGALSVRLPAENIIPDAELLALGIEPGDLAQPNEDPSKAKLSKKNYYRPDDALYALLQGEVAKNPGSKNALAMIDRFGNVLAVGVDTPAVSPIATAMMNLASGYSDWAFERYREAASTIVATDKEAFFAAFKETAAYRTLSPVSLNTFVYLKAPTPNEVATLKDLGIFGNTNDGVLQYIEPPIKGTMKQLEDQVRAMPLYYYASEHVSAVQSLPPAAKLVVTSLADAGPGSLRAAIEQANAAGRYRQITFAVEGTIRLASALPLIRVPVSIDGRAAVANPYAPRFATDPRVAINFNGRAGLQFAVGATGSQVIGLAIGGSGRFAISSLTRNLEITGNRFGTDLTGASRPNRLGSFAGVASTAVVTPPESPLVTIGRQSDVHRPLVFSGSIPVSGVRTDTVGGTIEVGLDPDGPGGTPATYFTVDPASPGALTSAAIESALAGATSAWRASLGQQQGGSFVMDVTASTVPVQMFPVARIPGDPTDAKRDLALTWLSQVGNTVTAEFSLAPRGVLPSNGNKSLMPYLGKTWTVSFMVPTTGNDGRGQPSEQSLSLLSLGTSRVAVGFYPVSSAASGAVNGLAPTDSGYAAAALAAAQAAGLVFNPAARAPAAGAIRTVSAGRFDPTLSYGIVFTVGGNPATAATSYQRPGTAAGSQYRFRTFALSGGGSAVGIEASPTVTSRDFADLVITLPSNARLRS